MSRSGPQTDASMMLSMRPDPIPAILTRQRTGRIKLVIIAVLAIVGTGMSLDYLILPQGWFYLALGWVMILILLGSVYVKSLGRHPYVESMLDLAIERSFKTLKWLIVAGVAWSVYDYLHGTSLPMLLWASWRRISGLHLTLMSGRVNLLQVACFYPWVEPLLETLRMAGQAREFEAQLAPRLERKIARGFHQARKLAVKGEQPRAGALLTEASELLASLDGYAVDEGLIYHRRLMRRKLNALMGLPVPGEPADPFMTNTDAHGGGDGAEFDVAALFGPAAAGNAGEGRTRRPASDQGYEQYREFFESLRERSTVTWADVAGLDEVVRELKTVLALSLATAPRGIRLEPPRRILLFGPPGTGKTLLTAAVSNSFDAPFYNVKVSDVLSKFFGESTRLLSALFELAAREGPAVLFFDEIESISGSRENGGMDGEERRMISALLSQLDGMKAKSTSVPLFTIAATNLPWQLDAAILSRFEKQFYIPLPDNAARQAIMAIHLTRRGFQVEASMEKLVAATRGYSGRELSRLCQEAIRLMLAEANPRMEDLAGMGQQAMSGYRLAVSPVSVNHFCAAFKKVRPQTDPCLLERYAEWQRQAG